MNAFYNFGIRAYRLGAKVAAGKNVKAAKMLAGQAETFSKLKALVEPGKPYLWVHAASLGEFEQGRPFIEMVKRELPGLKILLTFFSPSGYEVRKNYDGADIVCYLPFDTPRNAREFVAAVRPVAAVFVKYEFWGNYLQTLKREGVPTYLISSIFRPSQAFFKWWGGMFRNMLRCYSHIFVQDSDSAARLASIGMTDVTVSGDTRFDRVTDVMRNTHSVDGMEQFKASSPFTLVVGSSWEADEERYIPWLRKHPEVKCIVAPHEFDGERIELLRRSLGNGTVLMSEVKENPAIAAEARHVIVDCFGLLSSLYRYGDAAYVGGGFGTGIHNINEPAVYGIPVVFGPRHAKFKEATDLMACGGAIEVTDAASLDSTMTALLDSDERKHRGLAAGTYIKEHLGATETVFRTIAPVLRKKL